MQRLRELFKLTDVKFSVVKFSSSGTSLIFYDTLASIKFTYLSMTFPCSNWFSSKSLLRSLSFRSHAANIVFLGLDSALLDSSETYMDLPSTKVSATFSLLHDCGLCGDTKSTGVPLRIGQVFVGVSSQSELSEMFFTYVAPIPTHNPSEPTTERWGNPVDEWMLAWSDNHEQETFLIALYNLGSRGLHIHCPGQM